MRNLLERIVIYALLLTTIGSFTVLFLGSGLHERGLEEGAAQTSIGIRLVEAFVFTGCAAFILLRYRRMLVSLRSAWPFIPLVLLAVLSSAWSVDGATSIRHSMVFLSTTAFGIYLGGRFTTIQLQKKLLFFFLLVLVSSLVLFAVKPSYAVDTFHDKAFRGITEHKNLFGEYMGTFFLLSITYPFRASFGYAQLGSILLAATALGISHASTALVAAAVTVLMLPVLVVFRFPKKQVFPLLTGSFVLVAGLSIFAYNNSSTLLLGLGKDSTLTGRSDIWSHVIDSIARRPVLGYGYDAFWQGLKGPSLLITSAVGWQVPHSHNGYLEVLLALGAVGLALFLLCALRMMRDSILYLQRHGDLRGFWPIMFLLYYLFHATAEASLLVRDGLSYLLFVALSTSIALERHAAHAKQRTSQQHSALSWAPLEVGYTGELPQS